MNFADFLPTDTQSEDLNSNLSLALVLLSISTIACCHLTVQLHSGRFATVRCVVDGNVTTVRRHHGFAEAATVRQHNLGQLLKARVGLRILDQLLQQLNTSLLLDQPTILGRINLQKEWTGT